VKIQVYKNLKIMKTQKSNILILLMAVALAWAGSSACSKQDSSIAPTAEVQSLKGMERRAFPLEAVSNSGISGRILVEKSGSGAKVTVELSGTQANQTYQAHIHSGSVASPGGVAKTLVAISGKTGKSLTQVSTWDDGSPATYEQLTATFDGFADVHGNNAVTVAQGDIANSYFKNYFPNR
jgi:hypothetical protein